MTNTCACLHIALLSVISLSAGCGREEPPDEGDRPAPVAVQVAPARRVDRPERLEAGGVVAAAEAASLSSRVSATVRAVAVRAGDSVREGDVLVRMDARESSAYARQIRAAEGAAEQGVAAARSAQTAAAADQRLAAAWHGRIAQLRERNSATAQELDEAEARLAAAVARLAAADASVEQAIGQLAAARAAADAADIAESYAIIRAPFNGVVTERLVDPGTLALPGMPLLRVDAEGRHRVDVSLDEARAAFVRPGDRVAVLLEDGGNARTDGVEGTVIEVARAVAADQRAFTVKVRLPQGVAPRTGTFARVRFDGERRPALLVPRSAVRQQGQVASVFVVDNGVARIRLVRTGYEGADDVEIVAGLDAGEMVVTAPPPALADGRRVRAASAPAAGDRQ